MYWAYVAEFAAPTLEIISSQGAHGEPFQCSPEGGSLRFAAACECYEAFREGNEPYIFVKLA